MYLVVLADGRSVRAGLDTKARHSLVRLIKGDRVQLRLSPTDPTRGQITAKY
jgi:translation initiation factor IF-1